MYTYKYPHPALTTDVVVLRFDGSRLMLLLIERGAYPCQGLWALPGGFVEIDETVEAGAARELWEETGLRDIPMEEIGVFSTVNRDPRERVISVAFMALTRLSGEEARAGDDAAAARWFDVENLPTLAFDHQEVIDRAMTRLRERSRVAPVLFDLLGYEFSVSHLWRLAEIINHTDYDPQAFEEWVKRCRYITMVDGEVVTEETLYQFDPKAYIVCADEASYSANPLRL